MSPLPAAAVRPCYRLMIAAVVLVFTGPDTAPVAVPASPFATSAPPNRSASTIRRLPSFGLASDSDSEHGEENMNIRRVHLRPRNIDPVAAVNLCLHGWHRLAGNG